MESPKTSNWRISEGNGSFSIVNCTPKHHKVCRNGSEFGLYNLQRESSPCFKAGQEVLEVGWGDSPEPLNIEAKFELHQTPVACKKKLETKESPKSSIPFKRRNVRSTFGISTKSIVDVAKYVAEVQQLSKNIMKEFNKTDSYDESSDLKSRLSNEQNITGSSKNVQNQDATFDRVLQSFIEEEDDWLSQALSAQDPLKTPSKGGFVKSKSENELLIPSGKNKEKQNLTQSSNNNNNNNNNNINNNFRRTSSFDIAKPLMNTKEVNVSTQYSLQEIERKRLEAKYRRERREIERKKLEALKRLELKKQRVVKR